MVLPSSWVVLVASSVLPNLVANVMASLMSNMVTNLMANMVASVMTLRISWISSEDMARLDRGHMATIGVTLAVGSTMPMSIGKSLLPIAVVDSLPSVLVVDRSRVDGGGGLDRHMLGQRSSGGCEKSGEDE